MSLYEIFIKAAKNSSVYILYTTIMCEPEEIDNQMKDIPEYYIPPFGVSILDDFSIRYFGSFFDQLSPENQYFISLQVQPVLID